LRPEGLQYFLSGNDIVQTVDTFKCHNCHQHLN
jgi:hypothetical protein